MSWYFFLVGFIIGWFIPVIGRRIRDSAKVNNNV